MKKKSIKRAAKQFEDEISTIHGFLNATNNAQLSETHVSLCYEYAIIRLYREFEKFMLHAMVACLNHDNSHFSERTSVKFPKHLTQDVCQFLLTKGGYFDFKGRDGLLGLLKEYLSDQNFLYGIVKDRKYKASLDQLVAVRNYAAHDSAQ